MHRALVALAAALVAGCASVPPELPAVQGFELDRYLGRWYEIARLDHRFERGLTHVTADYRLREDGQVSVRNCGFKAAEQGWSTASGRARLLTANGSAQLAVSFFWPFESGYTVVALDADYRHSMVAGDGGRYLWILSREPELPEATLQQLKARAVALGLPLEKLQTVPQLPPPVCAGGDCARPPECPETFSVGG